MTSLYVFANPFNVWLNRRWIPISRTHHHISLWKTLPHTHKTVKSEKGKCYLSIIMKVVSTLQTPFENHFRPSHQHVLTGVQPSFFF